MHDCSACGGCGGSCGGCGLTLSMTREELDFLARLGQIPFLPVGRTLSDPTPIYLEEGEEKREFYSLLLACLEKKGLISLDYDLPLRGYDEDWYRMLPIRGSMALTARGQRVLELVQYQGVEG